MPRNLTDTAPTPEQLLNAISLVCQREGIMPTPENPNALGQVVELISRTIRAEQEADRWHSQFNQARLACYAFGETQRIQTMQIEQHERTDSDSGTKSG